MAPHLYQINATVHNLQLFSLLTQNIDKSYRISCVKCHQEISSYIFLAFDSGIGEMADASVYVIIPGIVDRLGDEHCTCFIYLGFKLLLASLNLIAMIVKLSPLL